VTRAAIAAGAFVEVLFPTAEKPRRSGLPHICYCLGVRPPLALIAYTTSAPWPPGVPLPFGVRLFSPEQANALNQKRPLRLYLNRQARIPLTTAWFPKLDTPDQGVIVFAPARLRQELSKMPSNWKGATGSTWSDSDCERDGGTSNRFGCPALTSHQCTSHASTARRSRRSA